MKKLLSLVLLVSLTAQVHADAEDRCNCGKPRPSRSDETTQSADTDKNCCNTCNNCSTCNKPTTVTCGCCNKAIDPADDEKAGITDRCNCGKPRPQRSEEAAQGPDADKNCCNTCPTTTTSSCCSTSCCNSCGRQFDINEQGADVEKNCCNQCNTCPTTTSSCC